MTLPEKPLYHTTNFGNTFYNGCGKSDCEGERIRSFDYCIVHLSEDEGNQYATRLLNGEDELVISSTTVDMNFVKEWIDRVSSVVDGVKTISVPLKMQDTILIGNLEFRDIRFIYDVNLIKLYAYAVRMFGVTIDQTLRLDEAELESELTLGDKCRIGNLSLSGCQTRNFGLSGNSIVHGRIDGNEFSAVSTHMSDVNIRGEVSFRGASLCATEYGGVHISAQFESAVDFTGCGFRGEAQFGTQPGNSPPIIPTSFGKGVKFDGAVFGSESFGSLTMSNCTFEGVTSFRNAEVFGAISFIDTKFLQAADLSKIKVRKAPYTRGELPFYTPSAAFTMRRTIFESSYSVGADVDGEAIVEDVTFPSAADEFSISASGTARFSRLNLASFSTIAISSKELVTVDQVQMQGGGEVRVSGARFAMTNCTCAQPVLALHVAGEQEVDNSTILATLKGTNCDGLTLSGFDYGQTNFLGATKLDSLIVTGEFTLRSTSGWRARRSVLAEEAIARASREHWNRLAGTPDKGNHPPSELRHLAAVYRALRKGREDQKDQPGSADFYYGEMEMRRLSSPPRIERGILTLYWLVSGYGLRAWRALTLLALVILSSALLLSLFPLRSNAPEHPSGFGSALLFSLQSGLSLSGSAEQYSQVAQTFQMILRVVVPVLIALAVLAVRGRVKR